MVTTRERVRRRGDVVEWQAQLDGAAAGEGLVNLGHERDLHSGPESRTLVSRGNRLLPANARLTPIPFS